MPPDPSTSTYIPPATTNPIRRTSKACERCRRSKAKCSGPFQGPPCTRCKESGFPCNFDEAPRRESASAPQAASNGSPSKPPPSFSNGSSTETRLRQLEADMATLRQISDHHSVQLELVRAGLGPSSDSATSPTAFQPHHTHAQGEMSLENPEIEQMARTAFSTFVKICRNWAPCISDNDTYDSLRERSPVLLFCILSVTSRFDPNPAFPQYCEQRALALMRDTLYSSQQPTLDDLKGTIVYNAWMSKGTPPGHSISLALQLELPRALETVLTLLKQPEGTVDPHEFESRLPLIRTWMSLYAQDLWLSVATGRRPMVFIDHSLHNSRSLLGLPALRSADARMVAQCELVTILGGVQDRFLKTHRYSKTETVAIIQEASTHMDNWLSSWIHWARAQPESNWMITSLNMQVHAAKFYACTLGLRDISSAKDISAEQMPVLKASLAAAIELQYVAVTYGPERMSFVTEFTHISVSSAALFLLKMIKLLPSALPDIQITLSAVRTAANLMAGAPVKLYYMAVTGALGHLETHLLSPPESGDSRVSPPSPPQHEMNQFLNFDIDMASSVQKVLEDDGFWSWAQSLPAESFAGILS